MLVKGCVEWDAWVLEYTHAPVFNPSTHPCTPPFTMHPEEQAPIQLLQEQAKCPQGISKGCKHALLKCNGLHSQQNRSVITTRR
jgi:hypothetical protein